MKISDMAAVPREVTLRGVVYKMSALSPRELGELERYIADIPIRAVKRQLAEFGDAITSDERLQLIKEAQAQSRQQDSLISPAATAALNSMEGFAFSFYLSVRHSSPSLTLEKALDLMDDFESIEELRRVFNELNMVGGDDAGKAAMESSRIGTRSTGVSLSAGDSPPMLSPR